MTLDAFRRLLLRVSPKATRYEGGRTGNYTVWREYKYVRLDGDNQSAERTVKIQVDRFTKIEDDPEVNAITDLLDEQDDIAFTYLVDYEHDTGYIHHIWDCEVA